MANNQIRLTPEQMHKRAGEYREQAAKFNEVITRMDTLLTSLQSEWEGAASESYAARYQELKPSFVKTEELIGDIALKLDQAATIYEQTDTDIAGQLRI